MGEQRIIIIGGGLAGLTLALDLLQKGLEVSVVEKGGYPRHKVCGEYISSEVLPYLQSLGVKPYEWGAVSINMLQFSNTSGKMLTSQLPLGGFGISRYQLDNKLYESVLNAGGVIVRKQVNAVFYEKDRFRLALNSGEELWADFVIGAYGKRSNLDVSLTRKFIKHQSPWLAVKSHYRADWDSKVVGLHNFKGGYCGISQVENGIINVCYLADFKSFQKHKDLENYREKVLCANPHLREFFEQAVSLFEKPITISQISFDAKERVHNHIMMCGDSASLIHPLCGNGMAMAILGAKILADTIQNGINNNNSRTELEVSYEKAWKSQFQKRLGMGRKLQALLGNQTATNLGIDLLSKTPSLFQQLIKATHGKPLTV